MADTSKVVMSVITTNASKLSEIVIKNGQLIFVQDKQRIALDFNNKRTFYNQITILDTDSDRTSMLAPVNDLFYFVESDAVLWTYHNKWIAITSKPKVYIGDSLPITGVSETIYINTNSKSIWVWDEKLASYEEVADLTDEIPDSDIDSLF